MKKIPRSKQDLVSAIGIYILESKIEIEEAGGKAIEMPEEALLLPIATIRNGYKWLKSIVDNELALVNSIRKLLSPELWDRYLRWGDFEDHRETKLLHDAHQELKKSTSLKNRPDLFKKGKMSAEIKKIKKRIQKTAANAASTS